MKSFGKHLVPVDLCIVIFQYWMYKFRDVNANITDVDARTVLQTHFAPASNIIVSVFFPIGITLSTFAGHKIRARLRVLTALIMLTCCLVTCTIFVGINTDSCKYEVILYLVLWGYVLGSVVSKW